jgi:hypothetical protein
MTDHNTAKDAWISATPDAPLPAHRATFFEFPALYAMSSSQRYRNIPRPPELTPAEYAYVSLPNDWWHIKHLDLLIAIWEWNLTWEAGGLRSRLQLPSIMRVDQLKWLAQTPTNVNLVPSYHGNRFAGQSALYHLLPRDVLQRCKLPLLDEAVWPSPLSPQTIPLLPKDYETRLAHAFAQHIWPLLDTGGRIRAFSRDDPIRLLAHNLDYWIPHVDGVIQHRMARGLVTDSIRISSGPGLDARIERLLDAEGAVWDRPHAGGCVWQGETSAWRIAKEVVERADSHGRLRALIDAIRSHRVEEDFSERWSFAREDFERKLYQKRRKLGVRFVELKDTTPVHGPQSEVHANLLFEDFLALLNAKERSVIVCLRSGITRVGEIARHLGYASHSPVSKALSRIRRLVQRELDA